MSCGRDDAGVLALNVPLVLRVPEMWRWTVLHVLCVMFSRSLMELWLCGTSDSGKHEGEMGNASLCFSCLNCRVSCLCASGCRGRLSVYLRAWPAATHMDRHQSLHPFRHATELSGSTMWASSPARCESPACLSAIIPSSLCIALRWCCLGWSR